MRRNPVTAMKVALAVVALLITGGLLVGARHMRAAAPATPPVSGACPAMPGAPCASAAADRSPASPAPPTATPSSTAIPSPTVTAKPSPRPTTEGRRTTPPPRPAGGGFTHPGVLVDAAQLDFVKGKVRARAQPWLSSFDSMAADTYASLGWQPRPRADVDCGSGSVPNNGCTEERDDALAAYTDALMWYITGDHRYADHAIAIMDAWATTIREHTNSNAPIQTGWSGASFARAGELIRYTYKGWDRTRLDRFATMLRTVYLPTVLPGEARSNGNHQLIELDAAIGIAVFLDDRASFDAAVAIWRLRVPAYIYLTRDGARPKSPPNTTIDSPAEIVKYWNGQGTFVDGLAQETCRDFGHTGWGLEAAGHVAATAWIQGVDLYAEMRTRMVAALEFHARFELGAPVPSWLCGGSVHTGLGPVLEVLYNHYRNVGAALPGTGRLVGADRPSRPNYFLAWETLTNADNPYA